MRFIRFFSIIFMSVALAGCSSLKKSGTELYSPVDFTEEDSIRHEVDFIEKVSETDEILACWRAFLLMEKNADNEDIQKIYNGLCSRIADRTKEFYSGKDDVKPDYFKALQYRISLDSLFFSGMDPSLPSAKQISEKISGILPGNEKFSGKPDMDEMIKGTVTVYVDKGIKIERGMGISDVVLGSGFFISRDGYIITNHHVINDMVDTKYEGFSRLYIKLAEDRDTRIPCKVVGYDSNLDLALLKAEINAPYVFSLGSSSELHTGDKVYCIGSPLGLEKTITSGIISSTDRQLFSAGNVFQLDAAVNSGNSGGPMINESGKVQGIVFAGVTHYQGLNFAIPVEYLKMSLPFLYAGGQRKYPWVSAYGRTKRLPGSGAKNEGVTVHYALPGSSADRAGLCENDVIISLNGNKVSSIDELKFYLMQNQSGTVLKAGVVKEDGSYAERPLYLEEKPRSPGYEIYRRDVLGNALYPILGFRLVNCSSANRRKFYVEKIMKNSAADTYNFSENDIVEIRDVQFSPDNGGAYFQILSKKRKTGFIPGFIVMSAPLDSIYYF